MRAAEEFTDPITMATCTLVVEGPEPSFFDGRSGVKHGDCNLLADVSAGLDAFYCPQCRWNGRISGAWAVGVLHSVRDAEFLAGHTPSDRG